MSLVLRYSPTEQVLRSVGDPPNGIVGTFEPDDGGVAFFVSGTFDPDAVPRGTLVIEQRHGTPALPPALLGLEEAVNAATDTATLLALWQSATRSLAGTAQCTIEDPSPYWTERVRAMCDFVDALRDLLVERGAMGPAGGDQ